MLHPQFADGTLPPHLWDDVADPAIPRLNLVPPGYSIALPERCAALSNSFAFGGSNASVILGRGW
jgi:3-oxoacyl-[acyl-carrier-protein] synthase-1